MLPSSSRSGACFPHQHSSNLMSARHPVLPVSYRGNHRQDEYSPGGRANSDSSSIGVSKTMPRQQSPARGTANSIPQQRTISETSLSPARPLAGRTNGPAAISRGRSTSVPRQLQQQEQDISHQQQQVKPPMHQRSSSLTSRISRNLQQQKQLAISPQNNQYSKHRMNTGSNNHSSSSFFESSSETDNSDVVPKTASTSSSCKEITIITRSATGTTISTQRTSTVTEELKPAVTSVLASSSNQNRWRNLAACNSPDKRNQLATDNNIDLSMLTDSNCVYDIDAAYYVPPGQQVQRTSVGTSGRLNKSREGFQRALSKDNLIGGDDVDSDRSRATTSTTRPSEEMLKLTPRKRFPFESNAHLQNTDNSIQSDVGGRVTIDPGKEVMTSIRMQYGRSVAATLRKKSTNEGKDEEVAVKEAAATSKRYTGTGAASNPTGSTVTPASRNLFSKTRPSNSMSVDDIMSSKSKITTLDEVKKGPTTKTVAGANKIAPRSTSSTSIGISRGKQQGAGMTTKAAADEIATATGETARQFVKNSKLRRRKSCVCSDNEASEGSSTAQSVAITMRKSFPTDSSPAEVAQPVEVENARTFWEHRKQPEKDTTSSSRTEVKTIENTLKTTSIKDVAKRFDASMTASKSQGHAINTGKKGGVLVEKISGSIPPTQPNSSFDRKEDKSSPRGHRPSRNTLRTEENRISGIVQVFEGTNSNKPIQQGRRSRSFQDDSQPGKHSIENADASMSEFAPTSSAPSSASKNGTNAAVELSATTDITVLPRRRYIGQSDVKADREIAGSDFGTSETNVSKKLDAAAAFAKSKLPEVPSTCTTAGFPRIKGELQLKEGTAVVVAENKISKQQKQQQAATSDKIESRPHVKLGVQASIKQQAATAAQQDSIYRKSVIHHRTKLRQQQQKVEQELQDIKESTRFSEEDKQSRSAGKSEDYSDVPTTTMSYSASIGDPYSNDNVKENENQYDDEVSNLSTTRSILSLNVFSSLRNKFLGSSVNSVSGGRGIMGTGKRNTKKGSEGRPPKVVISHYPSGPSMDCNAVMTVELKSPKKSIIKKMFSVGKGKDRE